LSIKDKPINIHVDLFSKAGGINNTDPTTEKANISVIINQKNNKTPIPNFIVYFRRIYQRKSINANNLSKLNYLGYLEGAMQLVLVTQVIMGSIDFSFS
jgi:hypothetical protein